ncbi:uncharacterized protein LOC107797248 [Nicotiana tabacum]|uniref:Uncharacterized protein n=1 Tax=Nicotiana tabacum TaxID=4097 RepID=A0A1S4AFX9_TOBAC|nr:PREDICTED: uncharacterized protein LOC107797248 [Nicotiana tabacum]XP_016475606.1 PREDICTED: uncharacterized protein LOC107797248 [Nicotiana tabacum]XP_016475607.1 PREDICTED: uncharacterized protein LOC107797248 [Nicotiana tabacum]
MEKLLNPDDKEYMKMAMVKHEETFREQVYELHRLYQIQKILMKTISSSQQHINEDESNIELTLGPSSARSSSHLKHKTSGVNQQRDVVTGHKWRLHNLTISNPNFLGERQSNPSVEQQYRQSRLNNPPWLFQVLI